MHSRAVEIGQQPAISNQQSAKTLVFSDSWLLLPYASWLLLPDCFLIADCRLLIAT
jgi:hypothetical protein